MSPGRAAAGPWEGPADGKNIGLDVPPDSTTGPRRVRETGEREPGLGRKLPSIIGAATREAVERANRAKLTTRQHRAFLAVLGFTTAWGRHQDYVHLGEVAQLAWGVEWAEDWQVRKTSEDLRALDQKGVIVAEAPQGRPKKGVPYRYRVEVPWPFVWVETHPESGSDVQGKSPRNRSESDPENGRKVTPKKGTPPRCSPKSSPTRSESPVLPTAARQPVDTAKPVGAVTEDEGLAWIRDLRKQTERIKAKGAA